MIYRDRRFLFPVVAPVIVVTAWAQQSPAAAAAEMALRARAEQFFQYQVDKKFRQAEPLVADDTKDNYYNGNKFNIKSFTIQKIELLDDNTHATVTIKAKVTLSMPGAGAVDFDAPSTTLWKLENGQWVWYVDPTAAIPTPFGTIKPQQGSGAPPALPTPGKSPDVATLQRLVAVDRDAVVLTSESPRQTVTVTNGLPGGVDLTFGSDHIDGFKAEIGKKHLEAGEKTEIQFTATGEKPEEKVVKVLVSPLGTELEIRVTQK